MKMITWWMIEQTFQKEESKEKKIDIKIKDIKNVRIKFEKKKGIIQDSLNGNNINSSVLMKNENINLIESITETI